MKKAILVAALLATGSAHAAVILRSGGASDPDQGVVSAHVLADFESQSVDTFSSGSGCDASPGRELDGVGGRIFDAGSIVNRRLAPVGDTSCYLSVGDIDNASGSLNLDLLSDTRYNKIVGFYWGSIDEYNYIEIRDGVGALVELLPGITRLTGTDVTTLFGVPLYSSLFIEAEFEEPVYPVGAEDTFTQPAAFITFGTESNWAIEVDSLTVTRFTGAPFRPPAIVDGGSSVFASRRFASAAPTPLAVGEPAAIGALGAGLGLLGLARRRRRG